jgi:hypothetical protein
MTGYALNQVTSSINKGNQNTSSGSTATAAAQAAVDVGNRLQIPPAAENRVPVVYGGAKVGSVITDAKMTAGNQTMWFALTICEVTGVLMSDGLPSSISFDDVYWNGNRIIFQSDGITASYMVDNDGNIDRSISGLVRVYCFANGSSNPVVPDNYTNNSLATAYSLMPGWTSNHTMSNLVFALVKVDYSREKNVTGLGNMTFAVTNTMTMPGDCLFDYMTSTRYGAGIDPTEIKSV